MGGYFLGLVVAVVVVAVVFGPIVAMLLVRTRLRRLEITVSGLEVSIREIRREFREAMDSPGRAPAGPLPATSAETGPLPNPLAPAVIAKESTPPALPGKPPATDSGIQPMPRSPRAAASTPVPDRIESLERAIGTRWLNWVGALVMLVGIAFLLKILYDRGWIGPAGRVAIGTGFGVALLYLGEFRFRRSYDLLSQSISATGSGALFLTTFLAYKFYEFGGPASTFLLLAWFAGFTVVLAVMRNGRVLAFLGLVGGYLTPYLLSTGEDHAEVLFGYLALLAAAAAIAHARRGWAGIPVLCFVLTSIYYVGWYESFYRAERILIAATGAAGLIAVAGALALSRGVSRRRPVRTEEILVLASAAVLGLGYLWNILRPDHPAILGLALCGVSVASLMALRLAARRCGPAAIVSSALLALAGGSLLLVIPATLKAESAMVSWALGAVLLAAIASRSGQPVLELMTGVCLFAALWTGISGPVSHTGLFLPMVNPVFAAWACSVLAWLVAGVQFSGHRPDPRSRATGNALKIASVFMFLGLLTYEAASWFGSRIRFDGADPASLGDWRTVALCLLWTVYPFLWLRAARRTPELWYLSAAHFFVTGAGYLSLLEALHRKEATAFLNPVFLAALLFPAGIFVVSLHIPAEGSRTRTSLQVYGHIVFAVLLAVELYQGVFVASTPALNREWSRMTLISAGWAVYASAVLSVGISRNLKPWRLVALALLAVTLLKVFLVDMAAVRQIWRVLSFLVLGALLMVCSYAYSRSERKKRLTEEQSANGTEVSS